MPTLLLPNAMKLRSCYPNLKTLQVVVALTLIRICGGFCWFNHLARAIPTPLAFDALQIFDADLMCASVS